MLTTQLLEGLSLLQSMPSHASHENLLHWHCWITVSCTRLLLSQGKQEDAEPGGQGGVRHEVGWVQVESCHQANILYIK